MGTQQPVAEVAQGATAAQELLNDISASGGVTSLQIVDTVVGTGAEARTGDIVTVNYIGVLPNGTVFDASQAHGKPFTFTLGAGQVIRGWEQGIPGMKVGGTRIVAIPPELGYGAQSIGQIPANASLIFQVELVSVGSGATQ
ncbi:FKBP-type peptidyl-prolyl cis-trans isomerase [Patescibacteria group bacterium]|nr:FKBP-type peptidyl-prolyl cis-trans isomerase [Patescibacteria group bacterium]